jgi:transcriptional regulator GlxA family with amidase domain
MYAQIVLFDRFDPLDVIAPFEVLCAGSDSVGGELIVELVSADGPGLVVSGTRALALTATTTLDPNKPGYVIVPGVSGPLTADPFNGVDSIPMRLARMAETDTIRLLRAAFENPDVTVATVCGGSLALAMTGLIEGRNAVTHHLCMDQLDAASVNSVEARIVDDGDFISAASVTSGLDLALHILERSYGPRVAIHVASYFGYERRGIVWSASGRSPLASSDSRFASTQALSLDPPMS